MLKRATMRPVGGGEPLAGIHSVAGGSGHCKKNARTETARANATAPWAAGSEHPGAASSQERFMSRVRNDQRYGARLCTGHPQIVYEARAAAQTAVESSKGRKTSLRGSNAKSRGPDHGGAPQKLKRSRHKGR